MTGTSRWQPSSRSSASAASAPSSSPSAIRATPTSTACFESMPLADDQVLVAGVIDTLTNVVEHP